MNDVVQDSFREAAEVAGRDGLAPHRPACWLWVDGRRHDGHLQWCGEGQWLFQPSGPVPGLATARPARHFALALLADEPERHRFGLAPLRITEIAAGPDGVVISAWTHDLPAPEWHAMRIPVAVTLTGSSVFQNRLQGLLEALTPCELLVTVADAETLIAPAAILRIQATLPWGGVFRFSARVAGMRLTGGRIRLHLRISDRRSMRAACRLGICECDDFSMQDLWAHGIRMPDISDLVHIRQIRSPDELRQSLELRRRANQFFGRRPEANQPMAWADAYDPLSIGLLVHLGEKPIAAGRLVTNDGVRSRSEIEAAVPLPDFLWEGGFAEVSRLVVHPGFRDAGVRILLFREIGRLALALGCRYLVMDSIPKLVPIYRKIGAVMLPLTKRHQDSDELEHVLYIDVKRSLTDIDRSLPYWLFVFGPALAQFLRVNGEADVRRLIGGHAGWGYGLKRLLAMLEARLSR